MNTNMPPQVLHKKLVKRLIEKSDKTGKEAAAAGSRDEKVDKTKLCTGRPAYKFSDKRRPRAAQSIDVSSTQKKERKQESDVDDYYDEGGFTPRSWSLPDGTYTKLPQVAPDPSV